MINPKLRLPVAGLTLGVVFLGIAWWTTHWTAMTVSPLPLPNPTVSKDARTQIDHFYAAKIAPLFAVTRGEDDKAVDRAVTRLHDAFAQFRAGLPRFADDLTSLGTRGGVINRIVSDQWTKLWHDPKDAHAVADYVGGKFKDQVVSEQKLHAALQNCLDQLQNDLQANHNRLAAGVKAAISMPDCPVTLSSGDWNKTFTAAEQQAVALAKIEGNGSVANGVTGFIGGAILTMAVEKGIEALLIEGLVTEVAADIVATSATAAASAGGTTAALGTGGGAVGTTVGPAGTIIGAGIGLIAGGIFDFFMTKHFREKMVAEGTAFLNSVESQIIKGQAAHPGLEQLLHDAVTRQDAALQSALLKQLETQTQ